MLVKAGLISEGQVEVALRDERHSQGHYRIGEILVLRGWLSTETVDFFVDTLPTLIDTSPKLRLGEYLTLAHLLTPEQVEDLLREQRQCPIRIGALAVIRGWIHQQTIDFFLDTFFPDSRQESELGIRVKATTIKRRAESVTTENGIAVLDDRSNCDPFDSDQFDMSNCGLLGLDETGSGDYESLDSFDTDGDSGDAYTYEKDMMDDPWLFDDT